MGGKKTAKDGHSVKRKRGDECRCNGQNIRQPNPEEEKKMWKDCYVLPFVDTQDSI
jgi:hypothetical protein